MQAVQAHVAAGGAVIGICNGFQILCEAHLLPGALMRNARLSFVSKPVDVRVERVDTAFTWAFDRPATVRLPVAHGEGRYVADEATLNRLEDEGLVVLRYLDPSPGVEGNPNGSSRNIAGICNAQGNVVGIMPHPERVVDAALGSADGLLFMRSMAGPRPVAEGVA
jgi:phosphoribosylformylglycinamidine synthase